MFGGKVPASSAALVWPAIALVFVAIFGALWRVDPKRKHLLGFASGFLALAIAMTFHIAFASWNTSAAVAVTHVFSSVSIISIVWGASSRLAQRIPLAAMFAVSLASAAMLFAALESGKTSLALSVQNASVGLLFGTGAIALWMARPCGVLDKALLWTMGALATVTFSRPAILFLLDADVDRMVERQSDFSVAGLIIMTLLTVVLGLCLVALALREAMELRLGARGVDAVSGFLNQRAFEQACETSLATARNLQIPACLAMVQLDWFDAVNERWGAESSNALTRQVSDVMRDWQRESDIVGRIAEDRLGVMIVGSGSQSALKAIQKLRDAVDRSCNDDFGSHMKFTLSISLAEIRTGMSFTQLFVLAAKPLEKALAHGGSMTFADGYEVPNSELAPPELGRIAPHA
jgi:diguanylate cyclase (GGDEF)-like protein